LDTFARSIFVFRRDLRIDDNTGLGEACRISKEVVPVFFLDPRQIEAHPYRSEPGLDFMCDALIDLGHSLEEAGSRLVVIGGVAEEVIVPLARSLEAEAVFMNGDVTPFSRRRDERLRARCDEAGLSFNSYDDAMVHGVETVLKNDGTPYTVFTPYFRRAATLPVRQPRARPPQGIMHDPPATPGEIPVSQLRAHVKCPGGRGWAVSGGRQQGVRILEDMSRHAEYEEVHDLPAEGGTTRLSAFLKFGCVSAREVWYAVRDRLGTSHPILRQLHWRDFFCQIAWHFPHVFGAAFHERFDNVRWDQDTEAFERWCRGETGIPLVDAGMRELNQTGFMHNRVRMVTASFLTKDLHIDWREGERYFARRLVDYDPAVNNGNWQWVASTGCDAQPWFRVFNPWRQQKRFDPDAAYIRRWVPELDGIPSTSIHKLWKEPESGTGYCVPMVDHREAAAEAKRRFAAVGK
jgi:deoxyribodipyrimidine photo-lyase